MTDDTKARLAELAARAEAATAAVVRPTDAELGQARAWAERVGHRWNAHARIGEHDAKTLARVVTWLLAERAVLRNRISAQCPHRSHHEQFGDQCGQCDAQDEAERALDDFYGVDPQLSLLGKETG